MKNMKITLDEEFFKEKVKVESLLGNVANKEDVIKELEKCLNYSQQRLHTSTTELAKVENKFKMKEDDYRIQLIGMQKKIDFFDISLGNERLELQLEREKYNNLEASVD